MEQVRIDLGCGKNKKEGFIGVDSIKFDTVDVVCNLGNDKWPFADGSVDEAHCSHMIEHLTPVQRMHFANELDRVLKPGAKCLLIAPHWASCRAYGDMTHVWPPVSEFWFYYLNREWRKINAPHDDIEFNPQGYSCDLECTWGFSLHPEINAKNQEQQRYASTFYKEANQDIFCTMTKKLPKEEVKPEQISSVVPENTKKAAKKVAKKPVKKTKKK